MRGRSSRFTEVPLNIVGSNKFGRYPKISIEETFNMIISDGFLVDYAGYLLISLILTVGAGRGIYTCNSARLMIVVIENAVYTVDTTLSINFISNISTYSGDVFIDSNNTNQVAICDLVNIYIYNYLNNTFSLAEESPSVPLDFVPGYITYQNGRFGSAAIGTPTWRLSEVGDGTLFPNDTFHVGTLQTKSDTVVAVQRVPSRGNALYVFGNTVVEAWQDVGAQLFPYQRNSSFNIDYGCISPATIAFNDTIVVWLAANEKSGAMIAYSTGGDIQKISTDGIDYVMASLTNPKNSFGFLFRQDGHLIYQITFPDDNLTYIYDFNTKSFFTLCDENMDAHIARRIAFFNNTYFFVSYKDGGLYEMNSTYTTYNGVEIPRIRVCSPLRMPDGSRFVVNNSTFIIEQGQQKNIYVNGSLIPQAVDLSISVDGGESFGTIKRIELNPRGVRKNRLVFWNLGSQNEIVHQFRFWGLSRFVAADGITSIYQ